MVQQVITLCDVCYDEGQTASAHQYRLTIGGAAWALELCDVHHKELVAPLADVAERLGEAIKPKAAKAEGKPKASGVGRRMTEPCLICGLAVTHSGALSDHLRRKHGVDGIAGAYGLTCAVCEYEATSSTALGRHSVSHTDGNGGTPEAFRYAAEHGDPHGIVAERLKALGLERLPEAQR